MRRRGAPLVPLTITIKTGTICRLRQRPAADAPLRCACTAGRYREAHTEPRPHGAPVAFENARNRDHVVVVSFLTEPGPNQVCAVLPLTQLCYAPPYLNRVHESLNPPSPPPFMSQIGILSRNTPTGIPTTTPDTAPLPTPPILALNPSLDPLETQYLINPEHIFVVPVRQLNHATWMVVQDGTTPPVVTVGRHMRVSAEGFFAMRAYLGLVREQVY